MSGVSFQFTAKDNTTKVFKSFDKSIKDLNKNIKALQSTLKSLSSIVSGALGVVKRVISTAVSLIVGIVKRALSTIKNLITGAFSFVRSALATLLSWAKAALGKVFDWIGSAFTKITQTTVATAKKAVRTIISSIQAYADQEYNTIQLRIAYGNEYAEIEKGFKDLLRYTTADRNDLWGTFATYAEMGKTAKEVLKYARATVYLSNATGKSLDSITRMLLMQETLSRDLDKTLAKVGVHVSDAKADMSDIDRIISGMQEEMDGLAKSLKQSFANVKNDLQGIKETFGKIFATPVKYILDKLDGLLKKILDSDKFDKMANKVNDWFAGIKDFIDDVFIFLEKFLKDPKGFFTSLWEDIKSVFANIRKNFKGYLDILAYVLGALFGKVIEILGGFDLKTFSTAMDALADALDSFLVKFAVGGGIFDTSDITSSFKDAFINAWNQAHSEFQLSKDDKWYKNLWNLLKGLLEDIDTAVVKWWNSTDFALDLDIQLDEDQAWYKNLLELLGGLWDKWLKPKVLSPLRDWWLEIWPKLSKTIIETFKYVGEVLGIALNNVLAKSPIVRQIINLIPGNNYVELEEAQKTLYDAFKDILPEGFKSSDITRDFLMSDYDWFQNWLYKLNASTTDQTVKNILLAFRKNQVLSGDQPYPSFNEFLNNIKDIWNPTETVMEDVSTSVDDLSDKMGPLTDALRDFRSIVESPGRYINGFTVTPVYAGSGFAGGSGGIQDLFSDSEFKIKPYAKGGLITKPTIALMGEDGPEYVFPLDKNSPTAPAKPVISVPQEETNWLVRILEAIGLNTDGLAELLDGIDPLIEKESSALKAWWDNTTIEADVDDIKNDEDEKIPWIKKFYTGFTDFAKGFGKGVGKAAIALVQNGALGTHMGNIANGIMEQQENGTLTIWTAIGEVVKEFLPYLQKGLEIVGGIFDKAFDILGNAVMKLGEEIGNTLLPLLESFIPFMKVIADIITALAPVISSVLGPAIQVICALLQVLTGLLDWLMPAFAGIGAVIQWVSDAISWAIGSFINWLASWIPWIDGVGEVHKPNSISGYYNNIMSAYNDAKNAGTNASMASAQTASQTVSYSGATHITINNDFAGSYIVGSDGMSELALIMASQLDNLGYLKVNIA